MPDAEQYFDMIDTARTQRAKELSDVKLAFGSSSISYPTSIASKAVVVLTYASWEGFYNDCVGFYLDFLEELGTKVADASWSMLVGALSAEFESLRSRNHSAEARKLFVNSLKERLDCNFVKFDRSVVMSRSNLNYSKLSENFSILGFDYTPLKTSRIRLDKEIVSWRHSVAHGDSPDLTKVNVMDHINYTSTLMLKVSDLFQNAILDKMSP